VDLPLRLDDAGVAHNSTGPSSVSIDLEIRKGSCGSAGGSSRQRDTLGEATLGVSGTFAGEAIRLLTLIAASQYNRRIDAEVLLHGTQATVLDRGASLDDEGDRGGPTLGRLLEGRLTRACTLPEGAFRC